MMGLVEVAGLPWSTFAGCAAAVLFSGGLRGFTGFGFALAATPLLTMLTPPSHAVPVVLLLQLGSSLVGVRSNLTKLDRTSTVAISVAAVTGTPAGVFALGMLNENHARALIAIVTAGTAGLLASGWRWRGGHTGLVMAPVGLLAGLLGGLCAMPGPPVIAYYMGAPVDPSAARASMSLIFLATAGMALAMGVGSGLVSHSAFALAALLAPAMIFGTILGGRIFEIAPRGLYRPIGIVCLGLIAATAAARSLQGG